MRQPMNRVGRCVSDFLRARITPPRIGTKMCVPIQKTRQRTELAETATVRV